jgi:hypothetical protein
MTEFEDIERRLREQRPELSALELDEVRTRVRKHADRMPRKGQSMKSRFAILLMLIAGMLVSTTGAGLAVQGSSGNGNAAVSQYPDDRPPGGVLGEEDDNGVENDDETAAENGGGGVAGDQATSTQPDRQVAAGVEGGGGELPFTGLAAIPIILIGVAMTATGVVLRRRSAND